MLIKHFSKDYHLSRNLVGHYKNFQNGKHKFKYAYVLTPSGIAEKMSITCCFLKRKLREFEELNAEIEAQGVEVSYDQEGRKARKA